MDKIVTAEGFRRFEAFGAFLNLAFCALLAPTLVDEAKAANETAYTEELARFRYPDEARATCAEAMALLVAGLEDDGGDFLGEIFMECAGNAHAGQFFTPYHLSLAMAKMIMGDAVERARDSIITIAEPACGTGGMVLAAAEALRDLGINTATRVHFTLTDIDLRCVKAAYIQTTLWGLSATIVHGNTLSLETWGTWSTLMAVAFPKHDGASAPAKLIEALIEATRAEITTEPNEPTPAPAEPRTAPIQLSFIDL